MDGDEYILVKKTCLIQSHIAVVSCFIVKDYLYYAINSA